MRDVVKAVKTLQDRRDVVKATKEGTSRQERCGQSSTNQKLGVSLFKLPILKDVKCFKTVIFTCFTGYKDLLDDPTYPPAYYGQLLHQRPGKLRPLYCKHNCS